MKTVFHEVSLAPRHVSITSYILCGMQNFLRLRTPNDKSKWDELIAIGELPGKRGLKYRANVFNYDCYNSMQMVDKHPGDKTRYKQVELYCPARDMNNYRGTGLSKEQCIQRCKEERFRFAGRQGLTFPQTSFIMIHSASAGSLLNAGKPQCFCDSSTFHFPHNHLMFYLQRFKLIRALWIRSY